MLHFVVISLVSRRVSRYHHVLWHHDAGARVHTSHGMLGVDPFLLWLHNLIVVNMQLLQARVIPALVLERLLDRRELKKLIVKMTYVEYFIVGANRIIGTSIVTVYHHFKLREFLAAGVKFFFLNFAFFLGI